MRIAALDYGTVTSRLLIADVSGTVITPLLKRSIITHLGEGLEKTGIISDAARKRVLAASRDFLQAIAAVSGQPDFRPVDASETDLVDRLPPMTIRAVATSAMRDAANRADLISELERLGIAVEIIAGQQEAQLCFTGTLSGFDRNQIAGKNLMVVDVGGGSTELTVGAVDRPRGSSMVLKSHSFDVGARRVTDRWLHTDPPTVRQLSDARAWIREQFRSWFVELEFNGLKIDQIIAVSGTPTTLISIRDGMVTYDADRVHGSVFSLVDLQRVSDDLSQLTLEARKQVVGLQPERAPVAVGGMMVLEEVLKLSGLDQATVSETDILQGIILQASGQPGQSAW
jgi:exopolyphosphatase/guanosine-5'-triphosphate,3'-diphosphate pyrophosphatase